jgi:hypothetical protein
MNATIISTFVGALAGGLVTYIVSSHYYAHAAEDLRREADQLARVVALLAIYMQREGLLNNVELDERGHLKEGYTQTLTGGGVPSQAQGGGGTLVQGPPQPEGSQESSEPPETAAEPPGRWGPREEPLEGAQEGVQRPWWRRVFGV